MTPQFHTYLSTDAPTHLQAQAVILIPTPTAKGTKMKPHPVRVFGKTTAEAEEKARDFWNQELAKEQAKHDTRKRLAEAARKRKGAA